MARSTAPRSPTTALGIGPGHLHRCEPDGVHVSGWLNGRIYLPVRDYAQILVRVLNVRVAGQVKLRRATARASGTARAQSRPTQHLLGDAEVEGHDVGAVPVRDCQLPWRVIRSRPQRIEHRFGNLTCVR